METVFFGSSSLVVPILSHLIETIDIKLVVTTEKSQNEPISVFCLKNNIEVLLVSSLKDKSVIDKIKNADTQTAVLCSFGIIITNEVLELFPKGILNIHPSLLPKYRGPTPVQTAILNGDKTTGVTVIKLDQEIDHGPILIQKEIKIDKNDNNQSLHIKLFEEGAKLLTKVFEKYVTGQLTPSSQDEREATYTKLLTRQSGYIDSKNPPQKDRVEQMVKAYFPWPGVWTKIKIGDKIQIVKLLPSQMLQVEGKKVVSKKDFINGYPMLKEEINRLI